MMVENIKKGNEYSSMPVIVLLGPQGSGKGTHGKFIASKLGIPLISTGDIFREEVKKETELGKKVREFVEKGELVPDEIVVSVVKDRIAKPDCSNGFVLDGFPRTIQQAKALENLTKVDLVIFLDVTKETIIDRLSTRRICSKCGAIYNLKYMPPRVPGKCDVCGGELYQRSDDRPEVIARRLEEYEERTKPLVEFYRARGLLRRIDGNGEREVVDRSLEKLLREEGLL